MKTFSGRDPLMPDYPSTPPPGQAGLAEAQRMPSDGGRAPQAASALPCDTEAGGDLSGVSPLEPSDDLRRIGPYHLLGVIGEGAMGVVYQAEQTEPVRRRVALKVMKRGADPARTLTRFEIERQALAVMSHPAVAAVLDAGVSEGGQPYFAMELVNGLSITEFSDAHRLSIGERLELFVLTCRGVQHAHQKGVIHRDLKPSNILVTEQDRRPAPKVIDFGIAKAVGSSWSDAPAATRVGESIGTPIYMSPEQSPGSVLDVDTRTDVYSLGAVLYELLVGRPHQDPAAAGLHEYMVQLATHSLRVPKPSVGYWRTEGTRDAIASLRRTDAGSLKKRLARDLDWVVMKALEPDRSRRYETVEALAADIQRFLRNEPVAARPPTVAYRAGRWLRRNRTPAAAAVTVAAGLVAGSALAVNGMLEARAAEAIAVEEAEAAERVTDFLTDLFRASDPGAATSGPPTVREVLDRGAERVEAELAGQPLLQARLLYTLGTVHRSIGDYPGARALQERAVALAEQQLTPDTAALVRYRNALAGTYSVLGNVGEAIELQEWVVGLGPTAGLSGLQVAYPMTNLAGLYREAGRPARAESLYSEVLDMVGEIGGTEEFALQLRVRLAEVHQDQGRLELAEAMLRQARAAFESSDGVAALPVGQTGALLGENLLLQGRHVAADSAYRAALAVYDIVYDSDHPERAAALHGLASVRSRLSEPLLADSLLTEAARILRLRAPQDLRLGEIEADLERLRLSREPREAPAR